MPMEGHTPQQGYLITYLSSFICDTGHFSPCYMEILSNDIEKRDKQSELDE